MKLVTWSSVLIREVSSFQGCPLRGVPLYAIYMLQTMPYTYHCRNIDQAICLQNQETMYLLQNQQRYLIPTCTCTPTLFYQKSTCKLKIFFVGWSMHILARTGWPMLPLKTDGGYSRFQFPAQNSAGHGNHENH